MSFGHETSISKQISHFTYNLSAKYQTYTVDKKNVAKIIQ